MNTPTFKQKRAASHADYALPRPAPQPPGFLGFPSAFRVAQPPPCRGRGRGRGGGRGPATRPAPAIRARLTNPGVGRGEASLGARTPPPTEAAVAPYPQAAVTRRPRQAAGGGLPWAPRARRFKPSQLSSQLTIVFQ